MSNSEIDKAGASTIACCNKITKVGSGGGTLDLPTLQDVQIAAGNGGQSSMDQRSSLAGELQK